MNLELTVAKYLHDTSMSLLIELDEKKPYENGKRSYWGLVKKFIRDNRDVQLKNLTYKQRDWLIKIREGLIAEAKNECV